MAKKKKTCLACACPGWEGIPHNATCRVGKKVTFEQTAAVLKEFAREVDDEEFSLEFMDFHQVHNVILNLAVLAFADRKRKPRRKGV